MYTLINFGVLSNKDLIKFSIMWDIHHTSFTQPHIRALRDYHPSLIPGTKNGPVMVSLAEK